jgi:ADP-heptose:LPS heptosyltransferase
MPKPNLKLLILRFSSIGDIILTTPVLRALKNQLKAEIHFLTKKPFAPLLEHNPNVSKIYALTEDQGDLIQILKQEN